MPSDDGIEGRRRPDQGHGQLAVALGGRRSGQHADELQDRLGVAQGEGEPQVPFEARALAGNHRPELIVVGGSPIQDEKVTRPAGPRDEVRRVVQPPFAATGGFLAGVVKGVRALVDLGITAVGRVREDRQRTLGPLELEPQVLPEPAGIELVLMRRRGIDLHQR